MKKILLFTVVIITLSILSCKKDNPVEKANGKITGYDMRKCMCCGGFFIEIQDTTYRFDSIPANSGITLGIDTFPIMVSVTFHKKDPQCMGDEIIIDRMKK